MNPGLNGFEGGLSAGDVREFALFTDLEEVSLSRVALHRDAVAELVRLPRLRRVHFVSCSVNADEVLGIHTDGDAAWDEYKEYKYIPSGWYSVIRTSGGTVLGKYSTRDA